MTKIKKATLWKNILLGICLTLAAAAILMIAFDAVTKTDGTVYKGYDITFCCIQWEPGPNLLDGAEGRNLVRIIFGFSFLNLLPYLFLILAVICCVGAIAYKKQGLVLSVLTMIFFVTAGILFLYQAENLQPYTDGLRQYYEARIEAGLLAEDFDVAAKIETYVEEQRALYELAWGPIVSAVCSFVAAAMALSSKIMWHVFARNEKV